MKSQKNGASFIRPAAVSLFALALSLGCSSSGDNDAGSGGSVSSGGVVATGGTSSGGSSTGGIKSSGGVSTGGVSTGGVSTGGVSTGGVSTGGVQTSGGTAGTAGGIVAGGSSGEAGKGGGGSSGGAVAGSGGMSGGANGGASSGAGGGAGSGGAQGSGSPGCGSASPLKSGNFTEMVDGNSRKFVLDVPSAYDASKPYRLIFVWHPLGGSADQVVSGGYNGLKSLASGNAILVAPEGMNGSNSEASGNGWWNVNDRDMKFLQAMLDRLNAGLCIDQERIFSTGFSFGGMMSYTVGYEFDVFRAIAPCSGDLQVIPRDETYTRPLPIMAFHGNNDTFVTTARGRAARDKYLARNKCGTQTMPVMPSPCVEYQGCSAPTFWCEFPGGHSTWSEQPQAIWKFFSQF
jgi:predicted esterase